MDKDVERYIRNWRDEQDGAALYAGLARAETDPVFLKAAVVAGAGATGGLDAHPASATRTSNQTTRWDMGKTSREKGRMEHAAAMAI